MTPLYTAAVLGHLHIVEFFISEGADVNKEVDEGDDSSPRCSFRRPNESY